MPEEPCGDGPEDGFGSERDPLPDPPFPDTVGTTPEVGLDAVDGVGDLDTVPDGAGGDDERSRQSLGSRIDLRLRTHRPTRPW